LLLGYLRRDRRRLAAAEPVHISPYSVSVAAIAAVFWPMMLLATNDANWLRLAAMDAGGTVSANAAS
jgi:hypothetical protein